MKDLEAQQAHDAAVQQLKLHRDPNSYEIYTFVDGERVVLDPLSLNVVHNHNTSVITGALLAAATKR